MDLLDRMLGHDHWATARLLEVSQGLTDAQLDQPFDIGHRTLRETLDHLIYVVDFWTAQMAGQPAPGEREGKRSIAELNERHECFSATFADVARRARDEGRLDDTFVDHFNYRQTLGGTIVHVAYHNAQHRSEARHILERLGVSDLWDLDPQEWEHATQRI
jgi:uncharacterized damage-inducible protein DinB